MLRQLKIIALACLLLVVFVAGVSLLFERKTRKPTEAEFDSEFNRVAENLIFGFTLPDSQALTELDGGCKSAPDASNPSCVEYVKHLRDIDPKLGTVVYHLDELLDNPPPNYDREEFEAATDFLELYTLTHEANLMLLEAWDSNDPATWVHGWELRDSLKTDS